MVFKRSEYRKQYKDPLWDCHFPHYKEKVEYRIQRRRMEHHHQIFDWDSDSENGHGDDQRVMTAPNMNNNHAQQQGMRMKGLDKETETPEWSQTTDGLPDEPTKRNVSDDKVESLPNQGSKHVKLAHHKKHRAKKQRPRDSRTPAARPSTSTGAKRVDTGKGLVHPPMVAFGWADRELETGSKKTHNIRASADPLQIYPAALRAMRRRELDIQLQKEKDKQQNTKEQKLKAMFNIQPRDDTVWLTEYRRNFIGPSHPR